MLSTQSSARTIDEAIEQGLRELDLTLDAVDIEILEEGAKGLFGIIGSKPARVRITEKDTPALRAERFLSQLTDMMGVSVTIECGEIDDGHMNISMSGDTLGVLIGHRGETLDAIQYLLGLAVNRKGEYTRFTLDSESYRKKREDTLVSLAERLAQKCKRTGRRVVLEPMNPYERRILHAALQNDPQIETHSEGDEPNRRVVITLAKG